MRLFAHNFMLVFALRLLYGCGGHTACHGESCASAGAVGDGSDDCIHLASCCDQLAQKYDASDPSVRRCHSVLTQAAQPSPRVTCVDAVRSLTHLPWRNGTKGIEYLCTIDEEKSGMGTCDEFIACAAMVAPATQQTLTDLYGQNGTCWTNGPAAADKCLMACEQNLMAYRDQGQCGEERAHTPDWLVDDPEVIALCEKMLACDSGHPHSATDMTDCEGNLQIAVDDATAPCDTALLDEYACQVARTGCDTQKMCAAELTPACRSNVPGLGLPK
jgi:hypothetical protein